MSDEKKPITITTAEIVVIALAVMLIGLAAFVVFTIGAAEKAMNAIPL